MHVRIDDRVATDLSAAATIAGAQEALRVLDISRTGCRIGTRARSAKVGATVVIRLPSGFELAGQISWRIADECGVKFYKPLSAAVADRLADVIAPTDL